MFLICEEDKQSIKMPRSSSWRITTIAFILLISLDYLRAFNVDVASRLVHRYDRNTKFGYSVDLYSDRSAHWVLVGAPLAQTRQPGVSRGGAVFKCSTVGQACYEIKFDERGANNALNGSVLLNIDSKSDQWFGATVSASRTEDIVVACAPRYTYFYATFDKKEPVGTCYTARNGLSEFREYSPCRGTKWGYHRLGFCMAGFSAVFGQDCQNLFVGAPGAYYWHGALATQPLDSIENGDPIITREGSAQYDDQYLGYSMASGDFDGQEGSDVAVGVPKGNYLLGQVAIYNSRNQNLKNISGEQVGSYFGASIAVSDLDNDGLDDLIVGAPMFTHQLVVRSVDQPQEDHEWDGQENGATAGTQGKIPTGGYEAGKVYVFWQREGNIFTQEDSTSITGRKDWARFGHAVAAVGDLNGDGFNDFIVGAPYDGQDGRGAVHVFNGNAQRSFEKASQIIYGEAIGEVKTFGFSLNGGVDVDGNDYPDIVVGAYLSDRAVLLKARPVVSVTGTVSVSPEEINLDDGGQEVRSVVTVCMNYSGKGVPDNLNLRLEIELDSAQSPENKRAHFYVTNSAKYAVERIELRRGQRDCDQQHHIVIPTTIRDKLSPILINVSYSVSDYERRFSGAQLSPVKNALLPQAWNTELKIANDCGYGEECIPDLQLSAESSKAFLSRGATDRVNLSIAIVNNGKDAHQAKFYVNAPKEVSWVGTITEEFGYRVTCTPLNATGGLDSGGQFGRRATPRPASTQGQFNRLECDIGNPFKRNQKLQMQVEYQVIDLPTDKKELVFNLEVNSSLPDDISTRNDNKAVLTVPLQLNVKIKLNKVASPDEYLFSQENDRSGEIELTRLTDPTKIGPYVSHTYSLLNDPSSSTPITAAKMDIFFPHFTQTNGHLLYVLYDIITDGKFICKALQPQNINPLEWILPQPYSPYWETPVGPHATTTRRPRRPGARRRERQAPNEDDDFEDDDQELGIGDDQSLNDRSSLSRAFLKFVKNVKEMSGELASSWRSVKELTVDCRQMHCTQWTCEVKDLKPGHAATVTVNSTLFLKTLLKENVAKATISSLAVVEVTKLPFPVAKNEALPVEAAIATTAVNRLSRDYVARSIPTWMIIVAILTGITLLILLILLFWRLGFFKRKRPPRGQAKLQSEGPEGRGQYSTYSPATQEYSTTYVR